MQIEITTQGQMTLPIELCHQLGIPLGGQVNLEIHQGSLILTPVRHDIQAAFGLLKARKSVSLEAMETAIEHAAVESYVQS